MKPGRDLEYLKAMYDRHVAQRQWKKSTIVHFQMVQEKVKQLRREIRQERKAS
jgi:hypothetical protein